VSERKRAATIAPTGRLTLHEPDGRSTLAAPAAPHFMDSPAGYAGRLDRGIDARGFLDDVSARAGHDAAAADSAGGSAAICR
jgi:hypothetical protein